MNEVLQQEKQRYNHEGSCKKSYFDGRSKTIRTQGGGVLNMYIIQMSSTHHLNEVQGLNLLNSTNAENTKTNISVTLITENNYM